MTEIGNVTVKVDAVITDEQYHEAMGAVKAANERINLLEAESEKLHELLQRTWDAFHNASSKEFNAVKRDLRELGIEVD